VSRQKILKKQMSGNFDRIAPYYNQISKLVFGNSIHQAQIQFLDKLPSQATVLIIGGGSGRFLKDLLLNTQVKKVLYIEGSAEMIRLSKKAIAGIEQSDRVAFITGTQADIPDAAMFDVVITHCFLNVFQGDDLKELANKLESHLKPGGFWLFSDFRISSHGFHGIWQRALLWLMYLFFRITAGLKNSRLESFDELFSAMRVIRLEENFFYAGMISSACYRKE
jgi:tRNA (cmo5U34)-methyltransferase